MKRIPGKGPHNKVCGAYGGTIKRLGMTAEIICQRSPGHKSPHIAAPMGWPQVWTRPVPRELPMLPKPAPKSSPEPEYSYDFIKAAQVIDPPQEAPEPEKPLTWWQRVRRWFYEH